MNADGNYVFAFIRVYLRFQILSCFTPIEDHRYVFDTLEQYHFPISVWGGSQKKLSKNNTDYTD
jgi:hypothetical protein